MRYFLFFLAVTSVWSSATVDENRLAERCREIQDTFVETSGSSLSNTIDVAAMVQRTREFGAEDKHMSDLKEVFEEIGGFGGAVFQTVGQNGAFSFMRVIRREGRVHALFRMESEQGEFNYHEYLVSEKGGKLVFSDVYIYLLGDYFSRYMFRTYLFASDADVGLLQRFLGTDAKAEEAGVFVEFVNKIHGDSQQEMEKGLELYDKLPKNLKYSKEALYMAMQAAQQINPQRFVEILDEFRKYHPNHAGLKLHRYTGLVFMGKWDEAAVAASDLNSHLGGDPYLIMQEGLCLYNGGKPDKAEAVFRQGLKDYPRYPGTYDQLAAILVAREDYQGVADVYKSFEANFGLTIPASSFEEGYGDFDKSQAFKTWKGFPTTESAQPPPIADKDAVVEYCFDLAWDANDGDTTKLRRVLSAGAILDRMRSLGVEESIEVGLGQVAEAFVNNFAGEFGKEGARDFEFIRLTTREERHHALFRQVLDSGGFSHLEFRLAERDGHFIFEDAYIYARGEYQSSVMHRSVSLMSGVSQGLLQRLLGALDSGEADRFTKFLEAVGNKKHADVVSQYDDMPESLRKRINVLIPYLQSASVAGKDTYIKAINNFRKYQPDHPTLYLYMIDYHIYLDQIDEAVAAVVKLDQKVDDPYLLTYQGVLYLQGERPAEAKGAFIKSMEKGPFDFRPYEYLALLQQQEQDYAGMVETYKKYEAVAGFEFTADFFTEDTDKAGFIASEPFGKWMKK